MAETSAPTLLDHLAQIEDPRRKEGRRYPLPSLLVMIIMAIMSGANGYREIARFLAHNHESLRRHLALKREAMPSHVTIRTVLQRVDFDKLNTVFEAWASHRLRPGAFVALDAKAIRSSISDYDNAYQDFVSIVSAFSQQHGTVVAMKPYHNKNESEINVARDLVEHLVEALGLEGLVVSIDALHCKKNAGSDSTDR